MISFISAIILLLFGYFFYSRLIEKLLNIKDTKNVPSNTLRDNIDYVPFGKQKNSLIQLLNIAGTGPVFGPILAALYGPVVFFWIVFGCIFAGAVHDFLTGVISLRNNGATIPALASKYLNKYIAKFTTFLTLLLLLLVATVFVASSAYLLFSMIPYLSVVVFVLIIFIYYVISNIFPIRVIVGKVYPYLGGILILGSLILFASIFWREFSIPEVNFKNMHPEGLPIYPLLFLVLSCGAISGFHSTQVPIIARTIANEKDSRQIFYGMMIVEGMVALLWAGCTLAYLDGRTLFDLIELGTPSLVVKEMSIALVGPIIGVFISISIIMLPITSGDSAFRGMRLIIGDLLKLDQSKVFVRLFILIPIFAISYILTFINFELLWEYFSWANQTLATIGLWIAVVYLYKNYKGLIIFLALLPALFMSHVILTYLFYSDIGLNLPYAVSLCAATICILVLIVVLSFRSKNKIRANS